MNKQQALEAILTQVRRLEGGVRERVPSSFEVRELLMGLSFPRTRIGPAERHELIAIAAKCVHLLRDEVEVVEGHTLDEWLADREEVVELRSDASPEALRVLRGGVVAVETGPLPDAG